MKQILTSALLFCFFAVSALAQDISIGTFNAEFLNKPRIHVKYGLPFSLKKESKKVQKFWEDEENRDAKLKEASAKVATVIKKMNTDIVTLTEVGDSADIQVLLSELKEIGVDYPYSSVCDCKDSFTKQSVAVLSKYPIKDVWPEIDGRSIYLEEVDGDSEGETGISKGMKVTVVIEQKEVDVFVLHFKSESGGFDSDAKRLAQATIARRSIIKLLNEGRNVIVTGDLNAEKKSPSLYRIRGFDDIYEELIQTGSSDYFENTDVRWTYNYKGEPEQIDHILLSSGIANSRGIQTTILDINDKSISDHNPVIVRLKLK